jgi:hypothetical protein
MYGVISNVVIEPVHVFVVAVVDGVEVVQAQHECICAGPGYDEAEVVVAGLDTPADAKTRREQAGMRRRRSDGEGGIGLTKSCQARVFTLRVLPIRRGGCTCEPAGSSDEQWRAPKSAPENQPESLTGFRATNSSHPRQEANPRKCA